MGKGERGRGRGDGEGGGEGIEKMGRKTKSKLVVGIFTSGCSTSFTKDKKLTFLLQVRLTQSGERGLVLNYKTQFRVFLPEN